MNFFVSGGARGLGRATVFGFLERGHNVAFSYNSSSAESQTLLAEAEARFPTQKIQCYKMDNKNSVQVSETVDKVIAEWGQIHGVVCNSGVLLSELVVNTSDEQWLDVLDVNLNGSFYLSRAFLMHFLDHRFGRVIFVSSPAHRGGKGLAAYAASKAGLLGLSRSIAKEYGIKGITSNAVVPGLIQTELVTDIDVAEHASEAWVNRCPLKRLALAKEVVSGICYLASEEASFVNGTELEIHGGLEVVPT